MICPYCNTALPGEVSFCSKCGQAITAAPAKNDNTRKFWDDVDTTNASVERERLDAVQKAKDESKKRRDSVKSKFIMIGLLAMVLGLVMFTTNLVSQEKLETVKAHAIGKTFADADSPMMINGDAVDRMLVVIKNDHTLTYTHGNYTVYVYAKESGGYGMNWSENEIYLVSDYEYSFRTNMFGQIFLEFNGRQYEVEMYEDGTGFSIEFYDN